VNSLPKSVTRQCDGCNLNPTPSAPESSTLTTRLQSHLSANIDCLLMCELFPACIVAIVPLVTKDQTIKWVLVTINPGLLAEWQLKRGSGTGDVLMLLLMLCCLSFVPVMICYIIMHVINNMCNYYTTI